MSYLTDMHILGHELTFMLKTFWHNGFAEAQYNVRD